MALTFQLEPLAPIIEEWKPLAQLHWEGTKSFRRHRPFNPDWTRYLSCNAENFFLFFTARHEGRLVGYLGCYVTQSMHSQEWMATEDTFFLHPDYRGGRNALRFLRYVIEDLRQHGIVELLASCEAENVSGIKRLLEFVGFTPSIVQYSLLLCPVTEPVTEDHAHVCA